MRIFSFSIASLLLTIQEAISNVSNNDAVGNETILVNI